MGRNTALSIVKIKFGANYQFHFMNILFNLVGGGRREEKIRNLHNHQNFKVEKLTKKYH
jgi:hypothetical protein